MKTISSRGKRQSEVGEARQSEGEKKSSRLAGILCKVAIILTADKNREWPNQWTQRTRPNDTHTHTHTIVSKFIYISYICIHCSLYSLHSICLHSSPGCTRVFPMGYKMQHICTYKATRWRCSTKWNTIINQIPNIYSIISQMPDIYTIYCIYGIVTNVSLKVRISLSI